MVKTVTLTAGTPQAVTFSEAYPFYWIDNKTSGEVYASVGGTPEPGKDGTYTIAAGSQLRISGGDFNGGIVLLGEGKVQVVASGIAACPFKSAPVSGGGEGGDADTVNGHTVDADVPADAKFTDTTYDAATQTKDGLMSAEDKTRLDGIEEGANKTVVDTALSGTSTNPVQNKVINAALNGKAANSHTHDSRYYTEAEIDAMLDEKAGKDVATQSADGLMSAEDKVKLDGLSSGGSLYVSGYYIGDGLKSRTISLGFKPSAVIVTAKDGSFAANSNTTFVGVMSVTGYPGYVRNSSNLIAAVALESNGFQLLSTNINASNERYHYIAFK